MFNVKINFWLMETKVFHSFMSSMLYNLSAIQRTFEDGETFDSDSVLAKSLDSLSGQVENLRISLVKGFDAKVTNSI